MSYQVTYLTVNGKYSLPSKTLQEAKADVKRLQDLNKLPGHLAAGIKIKECDEEELSCCNLPIDDFGFCPDCREHCR